MEDDYINHSHCLPYTFIFKRLGECPFESEGVKAEAMVNPNSHCHLLSNACCLANPELLWSLRGTLPVILPTWLFASARTWTVATRSGVYATESTSRFCGWFPAWSSMKRRPPANLLLRIPPALTPAVTSDQVRERQGGVGGEGRGGGGGGGGGSRISTQ